MICDSPPALRGMAREAIDMAEKKAWVMPEITSLDAKETEALVIKPELQIIAWGTKTPIGES